MKKLESQETLDAKQRRNRLVLSIFLIIIMVGSTAGYAISLIGTQGTTSDTPTGLHYNGQYWVFTQGDYQFAFTHSPEETKGVPIEESTSLQDYQTTPVFIVTNGNESVLRELGSTLGAYVPRIQEACYGPCDRDLPEKDCSQNLIIWNASETQRVYQKDHCVFIEGDLTAVDAFLYRLLGIA